MSDLAQLAELIKLARVTFTKILVAHTAKSGATREMYRRYLSMQYHLTKGVQRYFYSAASHSDLSKMRKLRKFLVDFANEEELHYLVAANDLKDMQLSVLPAPFDVDLWHSYFSSKVVSNPFQRLGAAVVLENLAGSENREILKGILKAEFLVRANTKFLVLHMHEGLPHGEQLLNAIASEILSQTQLDDLLTGASRGAVFYLRMVEWAVDESSISRVFELSEGPSISIEEKNRIEAFDISELGRN